MKKLTSGRSMFLFQLSLLLLLFLIAAVICVSLFVFSSSKNTDANDLNSAAVKAVSIADTVKACKSDLPRARRLLGADDDFSIYYDADWNAGKDKVYRAAVDYHIKDNLLTAVIRFTRLEDGKTLYCLETKEFLGEAVK